MRRVFILALLGLLTHTASAHNHRLIHIISSEQAHHGVTYIFAHGLGATGIQANMYTQQFCQHPYPSTNSSILAKPLAIFNFPDAKDDAMHYHKERVNMGQELDIYTLKNVYDQVVAAYPNNDIVLCGVSRGAVTILNTMAYYKLPKVKALILECPFDSFNDVILQTMKRFYLGNVPGALYIGKKIVNVAFPLVDLEGIFPIQHLHLLPKEVPILLIHSQHDGVVPINCSRRIYQTLRLLGHEHTYFLELKTSSHARALCGHEKKQYENVVHALYKKYNLPHHDLYALDGQKLLETCLPTLQDIEKRITNDAHNGFDLPTITAVFAQLKKLLARIRPF